MTAILSRGRWVNVALKSSRQYVFLSVINKMLLMKQNFPHWLHLKLLFWQNLVQPDNNFIVIVIYPFWLPCGCYWSKLFGVIQNKINLIRWDKCPLCILIYDWYIHNIYFYCSYITVCCSSALSKMFILWFNHYQSTIREVFICNCSQSFIVWFC